MTAAAVSVNLPVVLLTRPEAASRRFAALLRARFGPDLEVAIAPLTEIEYLPVARPPGPFDGVILTSESAVAALVKGGGLPSLPAWCVGARTASAARAAGAEIAAVATDAESMLLALSAPGVPRRFWHPQGVHVAARLVSARITVTETVIYNQAALPPEQGLHALLDSGRALIAPVFSPRSADLLGRVLRAGEGGQGGLRCVAISAAAAARLPETVPVRIAATPDARGMMAAIAELVTR